MSETRFRSGRELSRAFYSETARPILDEILPGRQHSACLFGPGSEVLGYDTQRSTDHDWGPRLQLLVDRPGETIQGALSERLPHSLNPSPRILMEQHAALILFVIGTAIVGVAGPLMTDLPAGPASRNTGAPGALVCAMAVDPGETLGSVAREGKGDDPRPR